MADPISDIEPAELFKIMRIFGVTRLLYKELADNDNSKQQIYLGSNFSVLSEIPCSLVAASGGNFKTSIDLRWIDAEHPERACSAPEAKLILYPQYPEVRLSGFLLRCPTAPGRFLQEIPKELRTGERNGRILFLGISGSVIYAWLALKNSILSNHCLSRSPGSRIIGCFDEYTHETDTRQSLIEKLTSIHRRGWIDSCRLDAFGKCIPYSSPNAGGYTLEAQFGIIPNGNSEPDFHDWELKAHSRDILTLLTPEPDGGLYASIGTADFTKRFGHRRDADTFYFTGNHRVGRDCQKTGLKLVLRGFNHATGKIDDPHGGIQLLDASMHPVAEWSFESILGHWGRKHHRTCYVQVEKCTLPSGVAYRYGSTIQLGQGTDPILFLASLASEKAYYDPACKVSPDRGCKARNQFRINHRDLNSLYHRFERVQLTRHP
ncbi:MAG: hypothetical protein RL318_2096 [Fibrobacterota bacterium]